MAHPTSRGPGGSVRPSARTRRLVAILAVLASVWIGAQPAFAGQAASGELFFKPCDRCHPVTLIPGTKTPTKKLPVEFKGHGIVLEGHDVLGKGDAACVVCHQDGASDPSKLIAPGGYVDVDGDVSRVCHRCHAAKYKEFKAGTHGRNQKRCTSAGCHDAHSPGYMHADPLPPFLGTGFQFKVLPERVPFKPLAGPPPAPPVETPTWFAVIVGIGFLLVAGIAGRLVTERQKR